MACEGNGTSEYSHAKQDRTLPVYAYMISQAHLPLANQQFSDLRSLLLNWVGGGSTHQAVAMETPPIKHGS